MSTLVLDQTSGTDDIRIARVREIIPPKKLIKRLPIPPHILEKITNTRQSIASIIRGFSDKLLVVVGPCSIHDPKEALVYAEMLKGEIEKYPDTLEIVMRAYPEKPRTSDGWKGLINDPHLDESYDIESGLEIMRKLLLDINSLGVPTAQEFLDPISPQYIGDLISWGAIGARTTESQIHRELTSGLSAPIGYKNGTDGNIKIAIDAMKASGRRHNFLSVSKSGRVSIVETTGNSDTHIVLRGGTNGTNYDADSIRAIVKQLIAANLPRRVMVDASHGNSKKNHELQIEVIRSLGEQIINGSQYIMGVMIESNLVPGAQKFTAGKDNPNDLEYGKSITDACVSFPKTQEMLEILDHAQRVQGDNRSSEKYS